MSCCYLLFSFFILFCFVSICFISLHASICVIFVGACHWPRIACIQQIFTLFSLHLHIKWILNWTKAIWTCVKVSARKCFIREVVNSEYWIVSGSAICHVLLPLLLLSCIWMHFVAAAPALVFYLFLFLIKFRVCSEKNCTMHIVPRTIKP